MVSVLMLITSLAGGGAERVASELSLHLDSRIKRRIVTLTNNITYDANEPPISLDIKFWSPKSISMIYALIIGTIKYRKILKQNDADISMSFLTLDNFINILANMG